MSDDLSERLKGKRTNETNDDYLNSSFGHFVRHYNCDETNMVLK